MVLAYRAGYWPVFGNIKKILPIFRVKNEEKSRKESCCYLIF